MSVRTKCSITLLKPLDLLILAFYFFLFFVDVVVVVMRLFLAGTRGTAREHTLEPKEQGKREEERRRERQRGRKSDGSRVGSSNSSLLLTCTTVS